jgi:hypothetical protein
MVILLLKALPFSWHAFITTQANQINMNLATLIGKIRQEVTLSFSSTHERKVQNLLGYLPKHAEDHPSIVKATIQIKVEEISHQTPSPNTILI